ncbi:MAG: hypothetical protein IPO21_20365 [Bacteroidales bacterium]|nr:hypothetical protein [Bacteroidales bacterium]
MKHGITRTYYRKRSVLFYRSYIQLLGGAGFIVLSLAILGQSNGKIAYMLYGAESTGERLHPTIIQTTRSIWKVYIGITLFSFIYLVIGTYIILPEYSITENIFDSINHAMWVSQLVDLVHLKAV